MIWPGVRTELDSRLSLGGEAELQSLELWNAENGGLSLWSGKRDTQRDARGDPDHRATREPGSALALLDRTGSRRVMLGLTGPASLEPDPEDDRKEAVGTGDPVTLTPALVLLDAQGKVRARLQLGPAPVPEDEEARGEVSPTFVLQDAIGRKRIEMGFDELGNPYLRMYKGDEVIWTAP
jgi:hypothetical protein